MAIDWHGKKISDPLDKKKRKKKSPRRPLSPFTHTQPCLVSCTQVDCYLVSNLGTSVYAKERAVAIQAVCQASKVCQSVFQHLVANETLTKNDKSPVTGKPIQHTPGLD